MHISDYIDVALLDKFEFKRLKEDFCKLASLDFCQN